MANRNSRSLLTLALVAVGAGLAFGGRLGIDWISDIAPGWESEVERFGQWGLGMAIVVLVIIPMFRIYAVFDDGKDIAGRDEAASGAAVEAKDKTKKS